jgi:GTPase SAR1 family protein
MILVGTKTDLRTDEKTLKTLEKDGKKPLTFQEGQKLQKEIYAIEYVECSARTSEGLENVFTVALQQILKYHQVDTTKKKKPSGNCLLL